MSIILSIDNNIWNIYFKFRMTNTCVLKTQTSTYNGSESTHKYLERHGSVISTVATDALVLKHQAISTHNTDQASIVLNQFHTNALPLQWTAPQIKFTFWKKWPHRLTPWGRVKYIFIGNLTIIGSDNGLLPGRHQAIIWTNARILLTRSLRTNFSEIVIITHICSSMKIYLKMSSGKWRPFCLGLNELRVNILLETYVPHSYTLWWFVWPSWVGVVITLSTMGVITIDPSDNDQVITM